MLIKDMPEYSNKQGGRLPNTFLFNRQHYTATARWLNGVFCITVWNLTTMERRHTEPSANAIENVTLADWVEANLP